MENSYDFVLIRIGRFAPTAQTLPIIFFLFQAYTFKPVDQRQTHYHRNNRLRSCLQRLSNPNIFNFIWLHQPTAKKIIKYFLSLISKSRMGAVNKVLNSQPMVVPNSHSDVTSSCEFSHLWTDTFRVLLRNRAP